jgi:hypothetical protein
MITVVGVAAPAFATTTPANIPNSMRDYAASTGARKLLVRADEALNAITYTEYRSTSKSWSDATGVYKTDCTGYLNRMMEDAVPVAYDELRAYRKVNVPQAVDYYYMIRSMAIGDTRGRWRRATKFKYAKPGDLLVWRYKETKSGSTGHAVIVVDLPVRDTRWSNVYRVRVSDSARSGHTKDNRGGDGSGVGAGYMLVKVNSEGQPTDYAWSEKGYFKSDAYMAHGRPRY